MNKDQQLIRDYYFNVIAPRKGNTMNEEILTASAEADAALATPKLTDAELEAILAGKPAYFVEGEEAAIQG